MLPKLRRIQDRDTFGDVYKSGKRIFSKYFTVFIKTTNQKSVFASVISQKVSKKAVERNKIRRRTYYIIKKYLHNIKEGYIIILSFKKEAIGLSYKELEENILGVFKRAGLFK